MRICADADPKHRIKVFNFEYFDTNFVLQYYTVFWDLKTENLEKQGRVYKMSEGN